MSLKKNTTGPYGLALLAGVIALVGALYAQVWGHQFLHWDDLGFYVKNPYLHGFTPENLWWIATSSGDGIWKPLTWLTFMAEFRYLPLDNPGPHLLINPVIHAANAWLAGCVLHSVLSRACPLNESGNRWASAFLAILIAVHPVQVEAVAWLSGRKEVLCAFFYLLAVYCWLRRLDTQQPAPLKWFWLALLAHALALLSKPMAVTVPAMLLVLDGVVRRPVGFWRACIEKWPFWALSLAMVPIAIWGQLAVEALPGADQVSPAVRLAQAVDNYAAYLAKALLPLNVVPYYPSLSRVDVPRLLAGIAAMVLLLGLAWRDWRQGSRLWFLAIAWFAIVFFPVSGWLQVGGHRVADRYAYLPVMSVYAAMAVVLAHGVMRKRYAAVPGLLVITLFSILSYKQVGIWENDRTLWSFTALREPRSGLVMNNLGNSYYEAGDYPAAVAAYRQAVALQAYVSHYRNLLAAYEQLQDWPAVARVSQQAAQRYPEHRPFHEKAAQALIRLSRYKTALPFLDDVLSASPNDVNALWGKAYALAMLRQREQALAILEQLLLLEPAHGGGHELKAALESQGSSP